MAQAQSSTEARKQAHEATGKAHEGASKLQEAGTHAAEAGHAAAGAVVDKARELVGDARQAGQQVLDKAGQTIDSATSRVGEGMQSLAHTVREHGPTSGPLSSATQTVASTLEQGGRYVQQEGLGGLADDLTTLIRNNPIPSLLVGVGIGFLLARITSRS
jgi:methyl-accepting chemotaxis protein